MLDGCGAANVCPAVGRCMTFGVDPDVRQDRSHAHLSNALLPTDNASALECLHYI